MSSKGKKKKESSPAAQTNDIWQAPEAPPASEAKASDAAVIEQELEELKERLQRLGADYQNYQKRTQRQLEQVNQLSKEEMARTLLAVIDNFEHTLEKGREAAEVPAVLEGVQIVYDHLLNVLRGHGVEQIMVSRGTAFDPNLHEAVLHEESDACAENTILRELAAGYAMNGRTLRPAKVSVAKGAPAEAAGAENETPEQAEETQNEEE